METKAEKMVLVPAGTFERGSDLSPDEQPVMRVRMSAFLIDRAPVTKAFLDDRWTNLVVSGRWFSELAEALQSFSERINGVVEGVVRFRLHKGNLTTLSKRAPAGLYYARFEEEFYSLAGDFSFPPAYALMGLPSLRRGRPTPATSREGDGRP